MYKLSALAATTALAIALAAPGAHATLVESISVPNAALTGFTPPYATVSITAVDSNTADVVFTSLTTNGLTFLMGDGGSADLNVNGAYTLGAVSASGPFNPPSFTDNTPGQVDGLGQFNLVLKFFDGYTNASDSISFEITNSTGLWTSDASVLTPDASGYNAAIHAFVCNAPCTSGEGAVISGFAANGETPPPSTVPEPASMALLGTALLGFGVIRRRTAS